VRLYSDGIPGTMPDGQGQFAHFDLGSADHIEVLRGPFSALYGNSSGGVISIFTEDAPAAADIEATAERGSYGLQRYALKGMGQPLGVNVVVAAAHFVTDGYRDHSAAERNTLNLKAALAPDAQSKLTLIVNAIDMPHSQDPLGLTRAQLNANPEQAGSNALNYNTRKSLQQSQLGLHYERTLDAATDLSVMLYGGQRSTTQYQSIPQSSQASPLSPGGVIDLARGYEGLDAHATHRGTLLGTALQLTGGVSFDNLDEARRGYLNFVGSELGVEGAERRSLSNRVYDLDEYLQAQWDPAARWRVLAGVRNSSVHVTSFDRLATAATAHTGADYNATNPVLGVTFLAAQELHLYGSFGRGFETPTLNDLAYRSTDGTLPGLNFALRPARSDNYEAGAKWGTGPLRATAAVFYIDTSGELAVKANAFGRSVLTNIPETQRRGAELTLDGQLGGGFSSHLAYTYIRAVVAEPYSTCVTLPCQPVIVGAGARLPAVPANTLYASLTWRQPRAGLSVTLDATGRARIFVDDRNSAAASGYWAENLAATLEQLHGEWRFAESLRVENLANRRYVDSVIVNATNSAFFEPDPGRSVYFIFKVEHR
jgi:iron complex outermembrane receptor protein